MFARVCSKAGCGQDPHTLGKGFHAVDLRVVHVLQLPNLGLHNVRISGQHQSFEVALRDLPLFKVRRDN